MDIRYGGSGPPRYDGWYCQLFYTSKITKRDETRPAAESDYRVIDIFTDYPDEIHGDPGCVVNLGIEEVQTLIVKINDVRGTRYFLSPVATCEEFRTEVGKRLTNEEWTNIVKSRNEF